MQRDELWLPWLYKFAVKGELKRWRCGTIGNVFYAEYGTVWVKGGAEGKIRRTAPKAIAGNSRERDATKQAQNVAKQEWEEKQRKDSYFPSDEIPTCTAEEWKALNKDTRKWPAVCKKWDDCSTSEKDCSVVKPWEMQFKVDGDRCTAWYIDDEIRLYSRKCLEMKFKDHIREQLTSLFMLINFIITGDENHYKSYNFGIDGEIWNPKLGSHQQSHSVSGRTVNKHKDDEKQCFAWFDIIHYEMNAERRIEVINGVKSFLSEFGDMKSEPNLEGMDQKSLCIGGDFANIFIVPTKRAIDIGDVYDFYDYALKLKFEGLVLRRPQHMYPTAREHRTSEMVKMKPFEDAEFEVIGFKQAEGDRAGCVVWECRNDLNDGTFSVQQMGDVEYQRELYESAHDYIGEMITVRYDGRSDDKIPVKPRAVRFRSHEDLP